MITIDQVVALRGLREIDFQGSKLRWDFVHTFSLQLQPEKAHLNCFYDFNTFTLFSTVLLLIPLLKCSSASKKSLIRLWIYGSHVWNVSEKKILILLQFCLSVFISTFDMKIHIWNTVCIWQWKRKYRPRRTKNLRHFFVRLSYGQRAFRFWCNRFLFQ